jgi:AcrR family transcriptional regulator
MANSKAATARAPRKKPRETREKREKREARPPGAQTGETDVRARVLSSAMRVFAEKGFAAPSVEDLLRAAGISRRTFYLNYKGKEDVALELYRFGTMMLLDACERAAGEGKDTLEQLSRCVDAHLSTVGTFGRLVYVLGGEAHRPESPLYARRMQVHARIAALYEEIIVKQRGVRVDPFLTRTMVLALEAVPRMLFEDGDEGRAVTDAGVQRARRVMMRVLTAVLEGEGPNIAPIPTVDKS